MAQKVKKKTVLLISYIILSSLQTIYTISRSSV